MSRIGKKPIPLPAGVEVKVVEDVVSVKGPKGQLQRTIRGPVTVNVDKATKQIVVTRDTEDRNGREQHGLWRALIAGMVTGVVEGYTKELEIIGIGFKAEVKGNTLTLNVGYAVPYDLVIPKGLTVEAKRGTRAGIDAEVIVTGIDKELVGQFAAMVRRIKKPDLYKGKGIRYRGEYVRKLAGKTFGTASS
jgi:large subunit ribosomal protein L6